MTVAAAIGFASWAVGIGLLSWAVHTTNADLGGIAFWRGSIGTSGCRRHALAWHAGGEAWPLVPPRAGNLPSVKTDEHIKEAATPLW